MADSQEEIELLQNLDNLGNNIRENIILDCDKLGGDVNLNNRVLNVLHLNIRSIRKNFNELVIFLESYGLDHCDIVVLTETWQLGDDRFYINGYSMYYNKADFNQNDGTVVYIKSNLIHEVTHVRLSLSKVTLTSVKLKVKNISFTVSCVYRPPSTSTPNFLSDLETYFADSSNSQIDILLGDINLNLLDESNNEVITYQTILNHFGFSSTINTATRVTAGSSSSLDHIFLRKNLGVNTSCTSYVIHSAITDHYPTMLNINSNDKMPNNEEEVDVYAKTQLNFGMLKSLVENQNFNDIFNSDDPEIALELLYNIIMHALNLAKSQKSFTKNKYKKIKPWITNGIISSIKVRDKMKKRLLLYNNMEDKRAFNNYRNTLNSLIKKCKHNYYKTKIEGSGSDLKKIYKVINEVTDSNSSAQDVRFNVKNDNITFSDSLSMANFCNKYFVDVAFNMYQNIKAPLNALPVDPSARPSMFLRPTNENEIIQQIASLKNSSAPGSDGITSIIAKHLHVYISSPLAHVINLIFRTAKVPKIFKQAVVKPIYKAGDKSNISNYRPISILNTFSKIFEKCLKDRLIEFLDQNKTLSDCQFGFKSGLSTTDAVCELCELVTGHLDGGRRCLAVFLDLARAFDTVPHGSLLQVLESYGIRGAVLDVFSDYLRDREQSVRIGNVMSDPLRIKIGIPQGTVLGPILFIVYINSLTNMSIENGIVISYADDTAIVFFGETWDLVREYVIAGINRIKHWLDSFKLSLNISKSNYIAFSLTAVNRPLYNSIHINGLDSELAEVNCTKYLGIYIDKHLKWDEHVLRLSKNIRKLIHKFYTLREILNKQLLITVYKAIVESLLRYGVIVWGGLYQNSLSPLNIAQNYILKVMFRKNKRFSTSLLYSREIFDVRLLYCLSVCVYTHKSNKFKNYVGHQYPTRVNLNKHLEIPIVSTTFKLKTIFYHAPKLYNLLPSHIKKIKIIKKFCAACRDYIFDNILLFKNVLL